MAFPTDDEDLHEETEPEIERDQSDDDGQDVDVSDKDGKTEVEVKPKGWRREERRREAEERQQRAIDAAIGPIKSQLQEAIALFQRQPHAQPAQQLAPARQQENDDLDPDLERITERQSALIEKVKSKQGISDAEADKLLREYRKLNQKAIDIRAGKLVDERLKTYQPPRQMTYQEQQLRSEFSDVFSDPDAEKYAASLVTQAELSAKRRGEPVNPMKVRQDALAKAAQDFGLRKAAVPVPRPSQVARFSNRSNSAGIPSKSTSVKRTLTSDERRAALAAFGGGDIPESKAIAKWTQSMEKIGYFDAE
jgi:hypothetical protein